MIRHHLDRVMPTSISGSEIADVSQAEVNDAEGGAQG